MEFKLEKWSTYYIEDVARYANNKAIAKNLRNVFPNPYTIQDAALYVNSCALDDERKQCTRAIVINGECVGSIGIFIKDDVYCKSGEIGYWLGEPFWGKGIMSNAITEICKFCFENYDIVRIFAEPFSYNIGSRKALEKAGFTLEGEHKKSVFKYGEFYDSCVYALIK